MRIIRYTPHGHILTIMAGHVAGCIRSTCGFSHQVAPYDIHNVTPHGGTIQYKRGDHRAPFLSGTWGFYSARDGSLSTHTAPPFTA